MADMSTDPARALVDAHDHLADLVRQRKTARDERDYETVMRLCPQITAAFEAYCTARATMQAQLAG
jgi:hypothetical protein